jgi:hypothetical protein
LPDTFLNALSKQTLLFQVGQAELRVGGPYCKTEELSEDPPARPQPNDPDNLTADFHDEKRSNQTHQSKTDPDARLYKKRPGWARAPTIAQAGNSQSCPLSRPRFRDSTS